MLLTFPAAYNFTEFLLFPSGTAFVPFPEGLFIISE
jgi:hypothetical protein